MISKIKLKSELSIPEKFFVDKILEIFHTNTIDSYRARMHNSLTILQELVLVLKDVRENKIKDFDKTVVPVIEEAKTLIKKDSFLSFGKIGYSYLIQLLDNTKKDIFIDLLYTCQVIVDDNKNYLENVYKATEKEIKSLESIRNFHEFSRLDKMINSMATGLVAKGYSKDYLYKLAKKIFGLESEFNFEKAFDCFKELATRDKEKFIVVFKFSGNISKLENAFDNVQLTSEKRDEYAILNESTQFFFLNKKTQYCFIECEAYDYLAVIAKARQSISLKLDLIHIGYNKPVIINPIFLVIGERFPNGAKTWSFYTLLDGYYKSDNDFYKMMERKLLDIELDNRISLEAKHKLTSGIRYLRLGTEAIELEQKFLNFWIGIEYLFSSYAEIHTNTITRLKDKLITAHKLIYLKRNLMDFHRDLTLISDDGILSCFWGSNIEYLYDIDKFDKIADAYKDKRPYISYKANRLKSLIHSKESYNEALKKHSNNLEWHLTRAYRLRNEIVHDAALNLDLKVIVGNLRYYLVFAINGLVDFFLDPNIIEPIQGQYTIDDYFAVRKIMLDNINKMDNPLKGYMGIDNPVETFS